MGKKSSPAPTPAPAPVQPAAVEVRDKPDDSPSARAAARRASEAESARASLLSEGGTGDVDPLTQKKQLTAGQASLMG